MFLLVKKRKVVFEKKGRSFNKKLLVRKVRFLDKRDRKDSFLLIRKLFYRISLVLDSLDFGYFINIFLFKIKKLDEFLFEDKVVV